MALGCFSGAKTPAAGITDSLHANVIYQNIQEVNEKAGSPDEASESDANFIFIGPFCFPL